MASLSSLTVPDGTTYDLRALGIPYGHVDSTSTSTVFTAQIPGITNYHDGLIVLLKNGVVTSAANFTININGLGAKGVYSNMAAATRETTIFNINYTLLLIYDSTRVSGGCWINYRGYNSDTNTIGYQLRTNSTARKVSDTARYYKIYFTSADGTHWVPASVNSTNNATTARPVNQRPIDPFGRIVYTSANTNYAAEANLAATTVWDQYNVTLGYSFNRTGEALTLTSGIPVYIKCAPQSNGSAIMDANTPYVQELPSTDDGKIYIFLGIATSATAVEMVPHHPVYYYKDSAIRLWTNAATSGSTDEAMTDEEIEDAIDEAFATYQVSVQLTNPIEPSEFKECYIDEILSDHKDAAGNYDEYVTVGRIISATGGVTVTVDKAAYALTVWPSGNWGASYSENDISTTGGVTYVDSSFQGTASEFRITGDGSITIDGINYGD